MATEEKQEQEEKAVEAKKPMGPPKSVFREYFESLTVTLIMALFGMTFIIQAVTVPTGSMQNTILIDKINVPARVGIVLPGDPASGR